MTLDSEREREAKEQKSQFKQGEKKSENQERHTNPIDSDLSFTLFSYTHS